MPFSGGIPRSRHVMVAWPQHLLSECAKTYVCPLCNGPWSR